MTDSVDAQHEFLGLRPHDRPAVPSSHPGAQWFPRAGLGLFIHWGIASVHGNLDLSWGMMAHTPWDAAANGSNKVAPEAYWALADRFDPGAYDPDPWIRAAAEAGFRYAVFTAMHHDGYTLWPSAASPFGVQSHLGGRDLVAPFVEACRRHGLRVGLYYSPTDWHADRNWMSFNYPSHKQRDQAGVPHFDTRHRPVPPRPKPAGHDERLSRLNRARIRELLTRYGPVDLLWLDGGVHDNSLRDLALDLQPGLVLNHRACDGHFDHSECSLPDAFPSEWFETCHCWQSCDIPTPAGAPVDVWGYLDREEYKSTDWMIRHLKYLREWNANFLVNVGPRPDGSLPPVVYDRFLETRDWMRAHPDWVETRLPPPSP